MWGKFRNLFARERVSQPGEVPVTQIAGEPTSVGVGLERELRDLAVLAREFEPLFAYRPDLIPLVTEVTDHDLNRVRKTLQEATEQERKRLTQSLEGLKPQFSQLAKTSGSTELQERLGSLLTILETNLPTRAALDHFHQLYAFELMRLPGEQPAATEVVNPLGPGNSELGNSDLENLNLQTLASDAPLEHSVYEQSLEAQGKTVAELKVLMLRYPDENSSDYQDFVSALTSLQLAQESNLIAPDLVIRARESYHRFESGRQRQAHSLLEAQKLRIQQHLTALQALPILPSLLRQGESTKRVLEDYLSQLNLAPLEENALQSAGALFDNFKKQLDLSYRSELMNLVGRAATAKATPILVELQHAGQMLEQGKYPDLAVLATSLSQLLASDKHRLLSQRRTEKFSERLESARLEFAPLAKLNNEEVDSVLQSLAYLEGQQEQFQKASVIAQRDLEKSLTQCKAKIKRLAKQYEATSAVAEELITSNILDSFFEEGSHAEAANGVVPQVAPTSLLSNV
jgi:hypothetical protein